MKIKIEGINSKKNTVQTNLDGEKKVTVGTYGINLDQRGIYDIRNKLNDLTGREWAYFTLSVMETKYPVKGKDGFAHELRKTHPSPNRLN